VTDSLPDRFTADRAELVDRKWRVPVILAYPRIGSVGEVGEVLVDTDNGSIVKVEISQIAEDLWDSILDKQDEIPLNNAQTQELDRRLERYRQDPTSGSTWESVKQRLGVSQ
jgi:putative addiction module component (TIGR02574 family)